MARPKQFDPEQALSKAIEVFWQQGYEATSVQDLVDHMGINRGSLYETFGDKRALFLLALNQYSAKHVCNWCGVLDDSKAPLVAIRKVFKMVVEGASGGSCKGCFIANSAVELGPHDREVATRVKQALAQMEESFYKALVRARDTGGLEYRHNPRALARYLTGILEGLNVILKARPEPKVLQDIVRVGLSILE